jgi:hypothetical protein
MTLKMLLKYLLKKITVALAFEKSALCPDTKAD